MLAMPRRGRLGVGKHIDVAEFMRQQSLFGFDDQRQLALASGFRCNRRFENSRHAWRVNGKTLLRRSATGQHHDQSAFGDRLEIGEPGEMRYESRRLSGDEGRELDEQLAFVAEMGDLFTTVCMAIGMPVGIFFGRRFSAMFVLCGILLAAGGEQKKRQYSGAQSGNFQMFHSG